MNVRTRRFLVTAVAIVALAANIAVLANWFLKGRSVGTSGNIWKNLPTGAAIASIAAIAALLLMRRREHSEPYG
jgi:hypothetical protein